MIHPELAALVSEHLGTPPSSPPPSSAPPSPPPPDDPGAVPTEPVDPGHLPTPAAGVPRVAPAEPWADPDVLVWDAEPDGADADAATGVGAGLPVGAGDVVLPSDDLTMVAGISGGVEAVLKEAGILTYADLAETPTERLLTLLDLAGDEYRGQDPTSWPEQAGLAAQGRWDDLRTLQGSFGAARADHAGTPPGSRRASAAEPSARQQVLQHDAADVGPEATEVELARQRQRGDGRLSPRRMVSQPRAS